MIAATLKPWGSGDLPLLERLMGDPHMTEHLGGPERPDKLHERQGRYERLESGDCMFKIVDVASGVGVGSVGFWTKEWRDEQAYEIGWMVVPEFQGRGIAAAATAQAIEPARRDDKHRFMHAFPDVDNAPSNAICRKLGFELLEACEFEFPKGRPLLGRSRQLGSEYDERGGEGLPDAPDDPRAFDQLAASGGGEEAIPSEHDERHSHEHGAKPEHRWKLVGAPSWHELREEREEEQRQLRIKQVN